MRVMVAMSGGVDSSVAAALLQTQGHQVVGATLKLWGGENESGCCAVGDVEDARRVAQQLGIAHHVFDFADLFERSVVDPYTDAHAKGLTPNPCIECNRHVKFGALFERVQRLGYDALATGHHARVRRSAGRVELWRGMDMAKDQSYVLSMLSARQLERLLLPVGEMTKGEVRKLAGELGLRTAAKPDSQDVCFVHPHRGRAGFLGGRIALHAGALVDSSSGEEVGTVPAVELVTVGQRRGLGHGPGGERRYAVEVDVFRRRVLVSGAHGARSERIDIDPGTLTWTGPALCAGAQVLVQPSAHGVAVAGVLGTEHVALAQSRPLVAPGQTLAFYDPERPEVVLGSAIAARRARRRSP